MKFTPGQSVFVYHMGLWWFGEVTQEEGPFDGPSGQVFYWVVRVAGLDHPLRALNTYLRSQEEHTMLTLTQ